MIAPERKAIERPAPSDCEAACAVRTLARTETSMPMKPAVPESIAPMAKPIAAVTESSHQARTKTTTPTMAMVVYWRRQIGGGAFADGAGNLLHAGVAGIGGEHGLDRPHRVDDAEHAARDDEIKRKH